MIRRSQAPLWLALLIAVETVFLWQYFATAEFGTAVARQFASTWRHGMGGDCLLYMPGYFAATMAIWAGSQGAGLARTVVENALAMLLATILALVLVKAGCKPCFPDFGASPDPGSGSVFRGVYTLACWVLLIVCFRQARERRSYKPLLVPLGGWLFLTVLRPPAEFGVLARIWTTDVLAGRVAAILSTIAIPAFISLLAARRRTAILDA